MKILIIHTGNPCECFIASSLFRGLKTKEPDQKYPEVYVFTADKECSAIFEHSHRVKKVYILDKLPMEVFKDRFDKMIVLHPGVDKNFVDTIYAHQKCGFHCSEDSDYFFDILYGQKKTRMNMFQIYFKIAGIKWRGQGYDFNYFPKSKCKTNKTGLAIANANLRNFIIDKLSLDESKLWIIPYKKNIFRKIDEINKCKRIVTDDFFTMNVASYLKKSIYFLKTLPYTTRIEIFNNGYIYNVPSNIIK